MDVLVIVFLIASIILAITAHEFMHAFTSDKLGDDTARHSGRLSLNPIAHIDPFATLLLPIVTYFLTGIPIGAAKPVPFNPYRLRYGEVGSALVAVAGPLTNLGLAVFMAIWLRLMTVPPDISLIFHMFILVNIGFFVFNMIPFPPLDGSRILYALAPDPLRQVMRQIETFGLMGIVFFILLLYPLISPVIGRIIISLISLLIPNFNSL
jgi:Zn-dependent protease